MQCSSDLLVAGQVWVRSRLALRLRGCCRFWLGHECERGLQQKLLIASLVPCNIRRTSVFNPVRKLISTEKRSHSTRKQRGERRWNEIDHRKPREDDWEVKQIPHETAGQERGKRRWNEIDHPDSMVDQREIEADSTRKQRGER